MRIRVGNGMVVPISLNIIENFGTITSIKKMIVQMPTATIISG